MGRSGFVSRGGSWGSWVPLGQPLGESPGDTDARFWIGDEQALRPRPKPHSALLQVRGGGVEIFDLPRNRVVRVARKLVLQVHHRRRTRLDRLRILERRPGEVDEGTDRPEVFVFGFGDYLAAEHVDRKTLGAVRLVGQDRV